jgi:hypothetical protein
MIHSSLHPTSPSPLLRLALRRCTPRPGPSVLSMSLKRKAGDQPADGAKKSKQNA